MYTKRVTPQNKPHYASMCTNSNTKMHRMHPRRTPCKPAQPNDHTHTRIHHTYGRTKPPTMATTLSGHRRIHTNSSKKREPANNSIIRLAYHHNARIVPRRRQSRTDTSGKHIGPSMGSIPTLPPQTLRRTNTPMAQHPTLPTPERQHTGQTPRRHGMRRNAPMAKLVTAIPTRIHIRETRIDA